MAKLNNKRLLLIDVGSVVGVVFDWLALVHQLADVNTGRASCFLEEIGQLLEVLVEVGAGLNRLEKLGFTVSLLPLGLSLFVSETLLFLELSCVLKSHGVHTGLFR